MFEYLRKHQKWVLALVTGVIIVSFSFFGSAGHGDPSQRGRSGVVMDGVFRTRELLARDGRLAGYAAMLHGDQNTGLMMLSRILGQPQPGLFPNQDPARSGIPEDDTDFSVLAGVNFRLIESHLKQLGIQVSDKATADFARTVPILQQPGGKEMVMDRLRQEGFGDADITALFRVAAGVSILSDLNRANMTPSAFETDMVRRVRGAGFSGSVVKFERANYLKPDEIKPEEIKAEYDKIAAAGVSPGSPFTTPEKRAVRFVLIPSPVIPDTDSEEDKLKKEQAYDDQVNQVYLALARQGGAESMAAAVKSLSLTPAETALFDRAELPKELAEGLDSYAVGSEVFTTDPTVGVGNPVQTSKGYLVFEVIKTEPARVKTLEEATEQIKTGLADTRAAQAALKAAGEAAEKWKESVKTPEELAKAAEELKAKVVSVDKASLMDLPPELRDARDVVGEILETPAGGFSKPVLTNDDSAVLVARVQEKFVFKDPLASDNAAGTIRVLREIPAGVSIVGWLNSVTAQAKPRWK